MHNNVMSPRFINIVFKRISFAIQKGLATQLIDRLSTIPLIKSFYYLILLLLQESCFSSFIIACCITHDLLLPIEPIS